MTVIAVFWGFLTYKVCSKSIRIGIVVVVHWVGCVCNRSWHVRTCLSNSWHKLHQTKFDEDAIRHPERGVRKMFPTVAATMGEVCGCGRELCWRQL